MCGGGHRHCRLSEVKKKQLNSNVLCLIAYECVCVVLCCVIVFSIAIATHSNPIPSFILQPFTEGMLMIWNLYVNHSIPLDGTIFTHIAVEKGVKLNIPMYTGGPMPR